MINNINVTIIPHTIDGNYIVFKVNHLSHYAVIGERKIIDNIPDTNDKSNNNMITIIFISVVFIIGIILVYLIRRKGKK